MSSSKTSSSLRCQFLHQQVELRRREMSSRSTDKEDRRGRPPCFGQIGADPFLLRSRFDVVFCEMFSRFPLCSLARVSPQGMFSRTLRRSLARPLLRRPNTFQQLHTTNEHRLPLLRLLQFFPLRPHIFSIFSQSHVMDLSHTTWGLGGNVLLLVVYPKSGHGSSRSSSTLLGFLLAHATIIS